MARVPSALLRPCDDKPSTALPGRSGQLLVVQLDALAPQQDVQAPMAEPPTFGSMATQPLAKLERLRTANWRRESARAAQIMASVQ
jgi:hypothetical protein